MMKTRNRLMIVTVLAAVCWLAIPAMAGVGPQDPAPAFTLSDQDGAQHSLADSKGKITVLEWVNPDCPFVKRHYEAGTMKKLATRYAAKDVVWMAVNSTHYMDAATSAKFKQANDLPYPILEDADGAVGKSYGALTTPHIFIIAADGTIAYQGAIDDDPRGGKGADAANYVAAALDELLAGKKVSVNETKPYGCSVKYAK